MERNQTLSYAHPPRREPVRVRAVVKTVALHGAVFTLLVLTSLGVLWLLLESGFRGLRPLSSTLNVIAFVVTCIVCAAITVASLARSLRRLLSARDPYAPDDRDPPTAT